MKTVRLRKATSFWRSLFFVGNICKMRKSIMNYLSEEGLKCELTDGDVVFEFNERHFIASFVIYEDYAECLITYQCEDEEYKKLSMADKTFVADKVNTDLENHATVYAFNDSIRVSTSFYFTSKSMMLNLFSNHFEELTSSLDEAIEITCNKMDEQKRLQGRKIGFNVSEDNDLTSDNQEIAARV